MSADAPRRAAGARIERAPAHVVFLMHQRAALDDALRVIVRAPLAFVLLTSTLAVALALPALLFLAVELLDRVTGEWDAQLRVNVFLEAPNERSHEALLGRLEGDRDVASVHWQSPEDSLEEFLELMGFENAAAAGLDALGDRPLPGVLVVTPSTTAPARLEAFAERLSSEPGVEGVQLDRAWVERLRALLALGGRIASALAIVLGFGGAVAVAGITTARQRAQVRAQQVLALMGAPTAFRRRPLRYLAAFEGAVAGLLAVVLVLVVGALLDAPLTQLARSYGLAAPPSVDVGSVALALPLLGAALAAAGAQLALLRAGDGLGSGSEAGP